MPELQHLEASFLDLIPAGWNAGFAQQPHFCCNNTVLLQGDPAAHTMGLWLAGNGASQGGTQDRRCMHT